MACNLEPALKVQLPVIVPAVTFAPVVKVAPNNVAVFPPIVPFDRRLLTEALPLTFAVPVMLAPVPVTT